MNNIKVEIKFDIELTEAHLRYIYDDTILALNEAINDQIKSILQDEYEDFDLENTNINEQVKKIAKSYFQLNLKTPVPKGKKK